MQVDTLFSLAESHLFSQLVEIAVSGHPLVQATWK
jgi:hypothetical protein